MKLTNTRITTLLLLLSAVVLLALSACSSDGSDESDGSKNTAPVADAGIDPHPKTGSLVTLDGAGSSDADHDQLFYDWSMTSRPPGSSATLSGADTSHPKFTADVDGVYDIELTVNDGTLDSTNDAAVTVTATHVDANAKPVARVTVDKPHPKLNELVTLDGSSSFDADDNPPDTLAFIWDMTTPPTSSEILAHPRPEEATFTPDVEGDYTIKLIVNDTHEDSINDEVVTVTATHVDTNAKPVADAGPDQVINTLSLVVLNGQKSHDKDHDPLTYSWTIQSRPNTESTATLSSATISQPIFTPDVWGPYVFKLIVRDGHVDSESKPDTVTVHATPKCGTNAACVFLTNHSYPGNLQLAGSGDSGLQGANNLCNKEASAAGLPGTYMAWLSVDDPDDPLSAIRNRLNPNLYEWYKLVSGDVVADTWDDLVDGTLGHAINLLASGERESSAANVWTGSYADGGAAAADCAGFATSARLAHGKSGSSINMDGLWTDLVDHRCSVENRLYCFQHAPEAVDWIDP